MEKERILNGIKEIAPYIGIIILVLVIKHFFFTTVIVHGSSMENTLHDKDIMILNKLSTRMGKIKRFDIVVIDNGDERLIKRVIGLPGEEIEYKENKLYIDGKVVKDNHGGDKYTADIKAKILGPGEYYVLGDNRTNSVDSRMLGPINKKKIIGKATFTIFPFNRIGLK